MYRYDETSNWSRQWRRDLLVFLSEISPFFRMRQLNFFKLILTGIAALMVMLTLRTVADLLGSPFTTASQVLLGVGMSIVSLQALILFLGSDDLSGYGDVNLLVGFYRSLHEWPCYFFLMMLCSMPLVDAFAIKHARMLTLMPVTYDLPLYGQKWFQAVVMTAPAIVFYAWRLQRYRHTGRW